MSPPYTRPVARSTKKLALLGMPKFVPTAPGTVLVVQVLAESPKKPGAVAVHGT